MTSPVNSLRNLFPRAQADGEVLNPNLYDVNNIEIQYYQARLQWPWTKGGTHALGWAFFSVGILAIFALLNLRDIRIDRRRLGYSLAKNHKNNRLPEHDRSLLDRMSTHMRSFTYLRTLRWGLAPISLGLGLLILAGLLFPLLYCFTQRPFYLEHPYDGPPPLAGRGGMMAIAMTPFIIGLGMKANIISLLTGIGHEKLNALHRWLALFQFFFALVHAIPFIVEPLKNGGGAELSSTFGKYITYWNGVGALGSLFYLCFASLPFLRSLCYEFFVHLHILMGICYIGFLFWHCNNMLTSWHYLWATVAIWASAVAYRIIFKANWFGLGSTIYGELATFTALTDDGVKITIPTRMRWQAGQHVFIRIPGISIFDNHPFTVASVMTADEPTDTNIEAEKRGEKLNDLVLVFKPHQGFTRRVYDISRNTPDITYRAYLDGPYGGLSRKLEAFETVLMIAGGSGITPVCGHLQNLAQKIKQGKALTRDIRIVWTVKHFECLEWFKDEIAAASRSIPRGMLLCQYYITKETPVPLPQHPVSATRDWPTSPSSTGFPPQRVRPLSRAEDLEVETPHTFDSGRDMFQTKETVGKELAITDANPVTPQRRFSRRSRAPRPANIKIPERCSTPLPPLGDEVLLEFGRPPLKDGLRPWSETFGKRACIYVCGPKSMKVDVANAVADMQHDIWASEDREEIFLHSETFGW